MKALSPTDPSAAWTSRGDFAFNQDADVYVCPQGKTLKTTAKTDDGLIHA